MSCRISLIRLTACALLVAASSSTLCAQEPAPTQIAWQRNLDDALQLVEVTGRPLLIIVNDPAEPLSNRLANRGLQNRRLGLADSRVHLRPGLAVRGEEARVRQSGSPPAVPPLRPRPPTRVHPDRTQVVRTLLRQQSSRTSPHGRVTRRRDPVRHLPDQRPLEDDTRRCESTASRTCRCRGSTRTATT